MWPVTQHAGIASSYVSARWSGSVISLTISSRRRAQVRDSSNSPAANAAVERAPKACERSSTSPSRSASALASCPNFRTSPRRQKQREIGVRIRARRGLGRHLERALHRLPERLAVVLEGVGDADLSPEVGTNLSLGGEPDRALEQRDAVVDLVAGDRELAGATQPRDRLLAEPLELGVVACPGEVGVLGPHGLRVVVTEEGGELVTRLADAFQPRGEGRVQAGSLCLGQAPVGYLARERVLDRVLALAGHRRA